MHLSRPMLAAPTTELDIGAMKYPKLGSAKIDGVRMLVILRDGSPLCVTRKLEPIPNLYVQSLFARHEFVGLDGELAVGPPTAKNLWQLTQSGVMSRDGTPQVKWHVFDKWDLELGYVYRAKVAMQIIQKYQESTLMDTVQWLPQVAIHDRDQLDKFEAYNLDLGFEGLILRDPTAPYKQNRSTVKQGWMLKIKRFVDGEAEVIGVEEQETNNNVATTDARGYTKRSSHAAGKEAAGVLGALQVRDRISGVEFSIGTGFTAEQRANLWRGREYLIGKYVKYKHFPIGVKDKPRHPVFLGFRDTRDL